MKESADSKVIVALDHVQLAMPEGGEEVAEKFYSKVLGFDRIPKPEPLARRGGCWFKSGGVNLHLGVESPFAPARKAHPAFLVKDLSDLEERLKSAGYEVVSAEPIKGVSRLHASDPFGNRLEFVQREGAEE